jgi:hypothetical protein
MNRIKLVQEGAHSRLSLWTDLWLIKMFQQSKEEEECTIKKKYCTRNYLGACGSVAG